MGYVLDDLSTILTGNTSFVVGNSLWKGAYGANSPDTAILLVEILGFEPPNETFGASGENFNWERPQIQIISRGGQHDYQAARINAKTAYAALRSIYGTHNGTEYHMIKVRSSPYYQGQDDNSRHMISFTLDVWKDCTTG